MVGVEKRQERPIRREEYERNICSLYICSKEKKQYSPLCRGQDSMGFFITLIIQHCSTTDPEVSPGIYKCKLEPTYVLSWAIYIFGFTYQCKNNDINSKSVGDISPKRKNEVQTSQFSMVIVDLQTCKSVAVHVYLYPGVKYSKIRSLTINIMN